MARILVVDDSLFMRTAIERALVAAHHQVVGQARDGGEGVAMAVQLKPDLIIMDIEMGRMDGLEATRQIMEKAPTSILVFSGLSVVGRELTVEALAAGAIDFLSKPQTTDPREVERTLIERVDVALSARPRTANRTRRRPAPAPAPAPFDIVAVAVSTGGPNTLERLLKPLPADYHRPIAVAQHMPPGWTGTLARHLDQACPLRIEEAVNGESLVPGRVYIAPGSSHMEVDSTRKVRLVDAPESATNRPSGDRLMTSAAQAYGKRCLGIVLTGMGQDGLSGARAIREAGGTVVTQDEQSAVIYGMPKAVMEAGLATCELHIDQIAEYLTG